MVNHTYQIDSAILSEAFLYELEAFSDKDLFIEDSKILLFQIALILGYIAQIELEYLQLVEQNFEKGVAQREDKIEELENKRAVAAKKSERRRNTRAIQQAKKDLRQFLSNAKHGKWRQYTMEEVQSYLAVAVNPDRKEVTKLILPLRKMMNLLLKILKPTPEKFRFLVEKWVEEQRKNLLKYAYYSQQLNSNYLKSKGAAWTRTCNITSLAMVLDALGFTPENYDVTKREILIKIYCQLEYRKLCNNTIWSQELSKLYLPDFLQLVAIEYFYEILNENPKYAKKPLTKQIQLAKIKARGAITDEASIFEKLASRFGLKRTKISGTSFDSIPSLGIRVKRYFNEQQALLEALLPHLIKAVWEKPENFGNTEKEEIEISPVPFVMRLAGYRYQKERINLGEKEILLLGPKTKDIEKLIEEKLGAGSFVESLPALIYLNNLTDLMIRHLVANNLDIEKEEELKEVQRQIYDELPIENVLKKAEGKGMKKEYAIFIKEEKPKSVKKKNDKYSKWWNIEVLWVKISRFFNFALEGSMEFEIFKKLLKRGEFTPEISEILTTIHDHWEKAEDLINKYQKSFGWKKFRAEVLTRIKPLLDQGAAIIVLRKGHYVFLIGMNEDGITLNDPASGLKNDGSVGRNSHISWQKANTLSFFRAYHVFYHPSNPNFPAE